MRPLRLLTLVLLPVFALAQSLPRPSEAGPRVGDLLPAFTLIDQNSRPRDLASVYGPKGAMIVFFRSADWWPTCKVQLVELEEGRAALEKQGYRLVAISYDSVDILSNFANRHRIGYTLLSDSGSALIKSLGLLNVNQVRDSIKYGVPYPGVFIVDTTGKIFSKHFKDEPLERETLNSILSSSLNVRTGLLEQRIANKHLTLTAASTNDLVRPYQRIRLQLDFRLRSKMHVYAPGVVGYKPIALRFHPSTAFAVSNIVYPPSKTLHLKPINETVPIYEGKFSIFAELLIQSDALVSKALNAVQRIEIKSDLLYQACDHKTCYLPETLPLTWSLKYENLLVPRVPESIQHKKPN